MRPIPGEEPALMMDNITRVSTTTSLAKISRYKNKSPWPRLSLFADFVFTSEVLSVLSILLCLFQGLESYKGYKFPVGESIYLHEASTISPRSKKAKN